MAGPKRFKLFSGRTGGTSTKKATRKREGARSKARKRDALFDAGHGAKSLTHFRGRRK